MEPTETPDAPRPVRVSGYSYFGDGVVIFMWLMVLLVCGRCAVVEFLKAFVVVVSFLRVFIVSLQFMNGIS